MHPERLRTPEFAHIRLTAIADARPDLLRQYTRVTNGNADSAAPSDADQNTETSE